MNRRQWQSGRVVAVWILVFASVARAQLSSDAPGVKSDREMRSERQRVGNSVEELARRMDDPQPDVRLEVVKALAESKDPKAHEYLMQAVGDSDPRVAATAVDALGRMGAKDASTFLAQRLFLTGSSPGLRQHILVALGRIRDPATARPILEFLQGETDPKIRGTAIRVIGEIGDASALAELRNFGEQEKDPQIKSLVQDAVAKIEAREPRSDSSVAREILAARAAPIIRRFDRAGRTLCCS
jgi:HEAT repeat protein